jgi:8-oxo-dGTP pyrophosphatase MutT (NUDIX family)
MLLEKLPLRREWEEGMEACVTVFVDDYAVLFIKRKERDDDPWSGQVALPGGRVKAGETPVETAIREAQEEVGLKPRILGFFGLYSPLSRPVRVGVFVSPKTGEPKPDGREVDEVFWADLRELKEGESSFLYKTYRIWGMTYRITRDLKMYLD